MENKMQVFSSQQFGNVRVVERDGEPWFVAADVCKALEIGNPLQAIARLEDDEKMIALISNEGNKRGSPNMTVVNEPGLYTLILSSRKPEAKVFNVGLRVKPFPMWRHSYPPFVGELDKNFRREVKHGEQIADHKY